MLHGCKVSFTLSVKINAAVLLIINIHDIVNIHDSRVNSA